MISDFEIRQLVDKINIQDPLEDDIPEASNGNVAPNLAEFARVSSDPEYRRKIITDMMSKPPRRGRGPYRNNCKTIDDMIKDKVWYLLPTEDCPSVVVIEHLYNVKRKTLY